MHCTDAPCIAVCPVNCIYQTEIGIVLHYKDLCIGCGYCFYACPFGAPQYPQATNFGSRGKMDKCTFCAGGPEADGSEQEYRKYGRNRIAEGKLPLCAEMCSTRALLAGDGSRFPDLSSTHSAPRLRLVILYGNSAIRPWLGSSLYAELARASAWSHMTFAVPFVLGVLVMIALWTRQNLWERLDWQWLKRGGGFLRTDGRSTARRFNAGQKLVFWSVVLGGLSLTVTGAGMMFPFLWTDYTGMQIVQSLHAAIALPMVGLIIGHIYIGTVGMEGAFSAMWSGWVDRNWAKEHHSLWYSGEDGEKRPAVDPIAAAPQSRPMTAAIGSFAIGIVVAIAIAVAMTGVFEAATLGTAAREAVSNPAVHLDNVMPGRSASRSGSQP